MTDHKSPEKYESPFNEPQPLRRGSLSSRFIKCGKPGCACAHDKTKRHGPYFSITRAVDGVTASRHLSVEEAKVAEQQISDGKQFRDDIERYWRESEQRADQELAAIAKSASDTEAEKKRAFVRKSRHRSRPKSTS